MKEQYTNGTRVQHTTNGAGTVKRTQQNGLFVMVDFDHKTSSGWGWAWVSHKTLQRV